MNEKELSPWKSGVGAVGVYSLMMLASSIISLLFVSRLSGQENSGSCCSSLLACVFFFIAVKSPFVGVCTCLIVLFPLNVLALFILASEGKVDFSSIFGLCLAFPLFFWMMVGLYNQYKSRQITFCQQSSTIDGPIDKAKYVDFAGVEQEFDKGESVADFEAIRLSAFDDINKHDSKEYVLALAKVRDVAVKNLIATYPKGSLLIDRTYLIFTGYLLFLSDYFGSDRDAQLKQELQLLILMSIVNPELGRLQEVEEWMQFFASDYKDSMALTKFFIDVPSKIFTGSIVLSVEISKLMVALHFQFNMSMKCFALIYDGDKEAASEFLSSSRLVCDSLFEEL